MLDSRDLKWRCGSCLVRFRDIPGDYLSGAIYIENEYNKRVNRYLRIWGWWLRKRVFNSYKFGYVDLTYLPSIIKKLKQEKCIKYFLPYLSKDASRKIADFKTKDLLYYLDDPDDARFIKPGFLFHRETKDNGVSIYEYYPLVGLDNKVLSLKTQIKEILERYKENSDEYRYSGRKRENRGIGRSGVFCEKYKQDENYADNMFDSLDSDTRAKVQLLQKQVLELKRSGVPMALLEQILHQSEKLSKLVITKKNEIILPDYNNMVIKMEPLVKAVFFLFLKHQEGIVFKCLPDYREELITIYNKLRPLGLNDRSLQSIEDVTNPCLNSINEKCARIRSAFINKFDEHLAKNYYITGDRGEEKKITLPRDLVIWE